MLEKQFIGNLHLPIMIGEVRSSLSTSHNIIWTNSLIAFMSDRDIKGANILVDPNGEIKLADFGMAKHVCYALLYFVLTSNPNIPKDVLA